MTDCGVGIDLLVTAYEKTGHDQQALALRSRAKVSSAHNELPDPWISSLNEDCYDDYQLALDDVVRSNGEPDTAANLHLEADFGRLPLHFEAYAGRRGEQAEICLRMRGIW